VLELATQVESDVYIQYSDGSSGYGGPSTLILKNTDLGDLTEDSFVFDLTPVEDPGLF
jgi:hypothetical protein